MNAGSVLLAGVVASALLAAPPPPTQGHGHDATVHHRFADVGHWVHVFDDPARDAWQKPEAVIAALHVVPGMTVADLGAGTGYFSVRLAKAVGPTGRVLALDVEPKLVEYMKERAAREKLPQMDPALVPPDDPKLPPAGVDLVLIVDTWHHIDDRLRYVPKLASGLKPGGRIAIVDFKKGDFPVGPPDAHKLPETTIVAELEDEGFRVVHRDDALLPYQYLLVFAPGGRG